MEMEILLGLRIFACKGRSNCGVIFGPGGDECAAFASLKRVKMSTDLTISMMAYESTQNRSVQHFCDGESLLQEKKQSVFQLNLIFNPLNPLITIAL